jgi:hypothetical protein
VLFLGLDGALTTLVATQLKARHFIEIAAYLRLTNVSPGVHCKDSRGWERVGLIQRRSPTEMQAEGDMWGVSCRAAWAWSTKRVPIGAIARAPGTSCRVPRGFRTTLTIGEAGGCPDEAIGFASPSVHQPEARVTRSAGWSGNALRLSKEES